ncbi:unnamed protein product [Rotaria sp. Silwood1]|nr:unnamed protein product [Rotaria sp. Silwood1]
MNNLTDLCQNIQVRLSKATSNSCEATGEESALYNLNLRIVSIFVLLVVSLLGASIAVVSASIKRLHIPSTIINTGKFFGTGVILATAFIHILPAAMNALTDECLPEDWKDYEAYAGVFAMLAILAMQLIEFIAHHQLHRVTIHETKVVVEETQAQPTIIPVESSQQHGHSHGLSLLQDSHNHRITTYLLEFGIAAHSVLIGLALGTNDGSRFVALFITLCFHQFFEAIALGAQISQLDNKSVLPAIFMVIFFALTTPVGIAIGIGVHLNTYNPKSLAALVATGVLDSVSSGILIYVALVNFMAGEMGVGAPGFFQLKKRVKFLYFVALYLGATFMAILGRWIIFITNYSEKILSKLNAYDEIIIVSVLMIAIFIDASEGFNISKFVQNIPTSIEAASAIDSDFHHKFELKFNTICVHPLFLTAERQTIGDRIITAIEFLNTFFANDDRCATIWTNIMNGAYKTITKGMPISKINKILFNSSISSTKISTLERLIQQKITVAVIHLKAEASPQILDSCRTNEYATTTPRPNEEILIAINPLVFDKKTAGDGSDVTPEASTLFLSMLLLHELTHAARLMSPQKNDTPKLAFFSTYSSPGHYDGGNVLERELLSGELHINKDSNYSDVKLFILGQSNKHIQLSQSNIIDCLNKNNFISLLTLVDESSEPLIKRKRTTENTKTRTNYLETADDENQENEVKFIPLLQYHARNTYEQTYQIYPNEHFQCLLNYHCENDTLTDQSPDDPIL